MKDIMILRDKELGDELIALMGERFSVAQTESSGELFGDDAPTVAVVRIHGKEDLDEVAGASSALVIIGDTAAQELLDRTVEIGAKYYFVSPPPMSILACRLAWLAGERDMSRLSY